MAERKKVYITMFGNFTISHAGKTVCESCRRDNMSWRLMKYLAANPGRPVQFSELKSAVWPAGDETRCGDGAMRVRLRRLRESLGELGLGDRKTGLVLYGGDRYRLNSAYEIYRDTDEAGRLYMSASDGADGQTARLSACLRALELFSGEYLENSLPAKWIDIERSRYRELFCRLALLSMKLMAELDNYEHEALLCAKALLIAPREYAFQTKLMAFLLGAGLTLESVAHYSSLSKLAEASGEPKPPLDAFETITKNNWNKSEVSK